MNISHHAWKCNQGGIFGAKGISTENLSQQTNFDNTPLYLTPDYFLPSSHSESYYSKKYSSNHTASTINSITHKNVANHTTNTISHHAAANTIAGIKPIYQSKSSKIARVASAMLLSLSFLATALEVKAQPNLGAPIPKSSQQQNNNVMSETLSKRRSVMRYDSESEEEKQSRHQVQASQQEPKKKPILTRAAHKISKRLGFRAADQTTREPEISIEELKELYTVEYGESMDATISRGVTADGTASGLAEALKKSLALREQTLERRRAEDIFSSEPIYSKPIDTISIATGSSTEYEEPWSDPDIEIGEAFEDEFSTSKKQQRFEPSAPPLSAFSSLEELNITTSLSREETKAIEMLDRAIEDSGYSSPNSLSSSSSPNIPSSPTNEVGFQGGYETNINNCSFYDTSSTEYDTEVEIRSYENVAQQSRTKKLRTRKARNASSAGAEARYSYRDIEQGLASFQSDTDFSDEWSDASSLSSTDGYDTVYTSSNSDAGSHFEDDDSEWDTVVSNDSSNEDELPPPPSAEELAALETQHIELEKLTEPAELNVYPKVSNSDEVDYVKATDVLEVSNVADIKDITEELQDENTTSSVLEILDQKDTEEESLLQRVYPNLVNTAVTEPQEQQTSAEGTITSKDELLKKASMVASSKAQARQASIIASSHIKHRIFAKDILVAAIAAGDESESDHSQILDCSVWSSGAFSTSKQKTSNNSDGYSTKISGGTIGVDLNFENDLLLGASFSKFRSNTQHTTQRETKKLDTYIASLYGSSPIKENLTLGVIGSAGYSKGAKAHSKLFSLETHLNYKIPLPQDIKLIPNIGLKYEYEKSKGYQEQITSNMSIACSKKSHQAFSTEIGSRVIFAPIKLKEVGTSNVILSNTILTPTAHFSVERRIGSRGGSSPYHLTYQGSSGNRGEVGVSNLSINQQHQKTSFNAGVGLIASRKNIRLELLYDQQRQKRFKSHQGVLKLKVSL